MSSKVQMWLKAKSELEQAEKAIKPKKKAKKK